MRLIQIPCVPSDVDQLTHITHSAIVALSPPDRLMHCFYGHTSTSLGRFSTRKIYLTYFTDPQGMFFKLIDLDSPPNYPVELIDPATGDLTGTTIQQQRILGLSAWRIWPRFIPEKPIYGVPLADDPNPQPILPQHMTHLANEKERDEAAYVLNEYRDRRRRDQLEPHVHLTLMVVDPEFQRRGLGKMLMNWGDNVADAMGVACWVEASIWGRGLYEKHGYAHTADMPWKGETMNGIQYAMRRPAKREGNEQNASA